MNIQIRGEYRDLLLEQCRQLGVSPEKYIQLLLKHESSVKLASKVYKLEEKEIYWNVFR